MTDNSVILNAKKKARKWRKIALLFFIIIVVYFFKKISSDSNFPEQSFIASINIEGIIFEDEYRDEVLDKVEKANNIAGLIVNINSPGGGIVGSEILYEKISKISDKIPVVVVMNSLAASGGYMVAIASDYIVARNGTITGSIGVIFQSPKFTGISKKIGFDIETYKSSPMKGEPSYFGETNENAKKIISESVDDSYNFFKELVIKSRKDKIKEQDYAKIFDGRIFTGRQALQYGLIDKIGGRNEALQYLYNTKAVSRELEVIDISLEKDEKGFLGNLVGKININQNLIPTKAGLWSSI